MALKTDYQDDVLNTELNTKRKYRMIYNDDGTVSFEDVTQYLQTGTMYSSEDVNAENTETNAIRGLVGDGTLETTAQNLVGGVNELNSKMISTTMPIEDSGFVKSNSLTWSNDQSYIIIKGNQVCLDLHFSGSITTNASGMFSIGTIPSDIRPKTLQTTGVVINRTTDGQIHAPAVARIESGGSVTVVYGQYNTTIGNTNYPWCTTDGIRITYDIMK